MDPIYDLPPELPKHTEATFAPVPAETLHEWPIGTFVENLVVLSTGLLALSVHTSHCVELRSMRGTLVSSIELPVPPAGLVARKGGSFYVAGGEPGQSPGRVWCVNEDGRKELAFEVPDALFLNGLTPLSENLLLAAESFLGRVYSFDLRSGKVEIWFQHEHLRKITSSPFMPGANGIKVHGRFAYLTNTDRATMLRIKIEQDMRAGSVEMVAEGLRGDDFAFDRAGNVYIATHIENSIDRLSPDGTRVTIAGAEQGMPGSTAVAFGRSQAEDSTLFVTTTGGLLRPYQRRAQKAKLIKLQTDISGAPLHFAI